MQDTVYLLCRREDDGSISLVSEHGSIVEGVAAGRYMVEVEDFDYSYGLYSDDGVKVASFADGRAGYREWAIRRGYISSQDDKYLHDEDRLVGAS